MSTIKIISAMGERGEIGYNNDLPWKPIKEDLKEFMIATMEDTLIMGRRTWESIGKQVLPGRKMVVVSRNRVRMPSGHYWCKTPEEAFKRFPDAWVIGGSSLYAHALSIANEMLLSHIKGIYDADRYFPFWDIRDWDIVEINEFKDFTQIRYVRKLKEM